MAECIYPKYLYREQYNECIKILKELYQWTNDNKFKKMYFNKKLRKMIKKLQ